MKSKKNNGMIAKMNCPNISYPHWAHAKMHWNHQNRHISFGQRCVFTKLKELQEDCQRTKQKGVVILYCFCSRVEIPVPYVKQRTGNGEGCHGCWVLCCQCYSDPSFMHNKWRKWRICILLLGDALGSRLFYKDEITGM